MNRFSAYEKPYVRGYEAPSTGDLNQQRAVLDMEDEPIPEGELGATYLPERITLRTRLEFIHYENEETLEASVNGRLYPRTFLYKPGYVKEDGSAHLKEHSKIRYVDFMYEGCGFYLNLHEQMIPFYGGSWVSKKIQLTQETRVFRKPFAVRETPLKMVSVFHRSPRGDYVHAEGFGQDLCPRYPYGGYCAPRTTLDQMEPVYCGAEGQGDTTVLVLEKGLLREGTVCAQSMTVVEQMNVGEAVVRGFFDFEFFHEGEGHVYKSCHFEHPAGVRDLVHMHFELV
jgi:hypothetical protein